MAEYCSECQAVEQGFDFEDDDENHDWPICRCCGEEDTRRIFDEDRFKYDD